MAIELDQAARESIETQLKAFKLESYLSLVEDLILGRLPGADILRMLRLFCQTSYLQGRMDASADLNNALKEPKKINEKGGS